MQFAKMKHIWGSKTLRSVIAFSSGDFYRWSETKKCYCGVKWLMGLSMPSLCFLNDQVSDGISLPTTFPWATETGTGRTRCFYVCDNVIKYHTVRYFLTKFWLLIVFNIQKQPYQYGTYVSRLLRMIPDPQALCQDYYSSATYVIGNLLWGYVWILS